jgi:hypothetical protein
MTSAHSSRVSLHGTAGFPAYRKTALPWGWWAFFGGLGITYIVFGRAHDIPMIVVLSLLFPLCLQIFPAVRLDPKFVLTPKGWALFSFVQAGFIEPLNIAIFDARPPMDFALEHNDIYLNLSLGLLAVGFVSYCCGYQRATTRSRTAPTTRRCWKTPHFLLAAISAVLGVASILILYGSFAGYAHYISTPAESRRFADSLAGTWNGVWGPLFRPFFPFAVIVIWCKIIGSTQRRFSTASLAIITVLTAPVVIIAAGSFNRGSMLVPIVAMLAVFSAHVHRIRIPVMIVIGVPVLVLACVYGAYRHGDKDAERALTPEGSAGLLSATDVGSNFAYTFVAATALERHGLAAMPRFGRTFVSSVIQPLPMIGKPFRETGGTATYNRLIYGRDDFEDQVIPFYIELFVDLHLPGIVLGYYVFAGLMHRLERAFQHAARSSALLTYATFVVGFWTACLGIGSVAVVSQMYIYAFGPIYLTLWLSRPTVLATPHQILVIRYPAVSAS